jgi:hypothetical protein
VILLDGRRDRREMVNAGELHDSCSAALSKEIGLASSAH